MPLSIVNWNVMWATPRSRRTPEILKRIDLHSPEVVCLTETHIDLLSPDGCTIYSGADAGYGVKEGRRKVLLWSKEPWERVDDVGADSIPPGRFVCGVTQTSLGKVTVMGICIPWFGSRNDPSRGSERKRPWEDHEQYISGLSEILQQAPSERLIVMGDFNQRIGQRSSTVPLKLRSALQSAFQPRIQNAQPRITIATAALGFQGRRTIDHIVMTGDLTAESLSAISNIDGERELSDHCGIAATIS